MRRAALATMTAVVGACAAPMPDQLTPCGGRMALGDDLVVVDCAGLAAFDLDGTQRWAAGQRTGGLIVPDDGAELYYGGVFGVDAGVFAAAKATGAARPIAVFPDDGTRALEVAVAGDQLYWIESIAASPATTLRRAPRAGGAVVDVRTSTNGMRSLAADATAVYWVELGATVVDVLRLDVATDQVTELGRLDGLGVLLLGLAVAGGAVLEVQRPDLTIDAYRVAAGVAPVRVAHDTRGTLAAGGGYLMAGGIRIDPDGEADRIVPAWPNEVDWVAIHGADLYFTDGIALWRRPLEGDASVGRPTGELGPPLVGVPP